MLDPIKPYSAKNFLLKGLDRNNNESGMLDITVYHEEMKEPLPNAIVKIYKVSVSGEYNEKGEGMLIRQFKTDINGKIYPVVLPVLNETMEDKNDYYYIAIHHPTHHSAYIFNVEIYPGITTSFEVYLKFRYSNQEYFQFNMQPRRSEIYQQ